MQSTALEILPKIIRAVSYTLGNFEVEQNFIFADDVKDGFEALEIKLAVAETARAEKKSKGYHNEDHEEPPDNFRNISIYPLPAEITTNDRPFLRENIVEGKYKNVDHYLDVQFRLLREDFVAPLREGICNYMKGETKRSTNIKIYHRVVFISIALTQEQIGFLVQFETGKKNNVHFSNSKRFMYGSLILFTADNFRTIFFGKVVGRYTPLLNIGQVIIGFQEGIKPSFDIEYTMVESTVYFEPYFHVLTALQTLQPGHFPLQKYLVDVEACDETPSYFDEPEFKYKLSTNFYPFYDSDSSLTATYDDWFYDADSYLMAEYKAAYKSIVQPLTQSYPLQSYLGLNNSQSIAFREALTNKFSIIQGPPGTGKTHLALKVVKTLLTNHNVWKSAPMLIVCYTNHALDQFLEGLLDTTKEIVRVGGQSKNEILQNYNLSRLRRTFRTTLSAGALIDELKYELRDLAKSLNHYSNELYLSLNGLRVVRFSNFKHVDPEFINSWFNSAEDDELIDWLLGGNSENERDFEMKNYRIDELTTEIDNIGTDEEEMANIMNVPEHFLEMDDEVLEKNLNFDFYNLTSLYKIDSCICQLEKKLTRLKHNSIEYYMASIERDGLIDNRSYLASRLREVRTFEVQQKPTNNLTAPYSMPGVLRWRLYSYWLYRYRKLIKNKIDLMDVKYRRLCEQYKEVKCIEDTQLMKQALVIGMTTTGAARLQTTLQSLKCPIVIVEEAAEVLESHIISALTSHCQHLILIGDHQQLRPSTASYRIEKDFKLGISLFERMIKNKIQCNVLTVQHRMRPDIARLIVPAIYEKLENHASVYEYPDITGIDKHLYFIHHNEPEWCSPDNSKENDHEAQYVILLARHLLLNGYKSEDITILAAYSGQLFNLMERRKNTPILQKVRICILDNYQGEECKIILLSLVRNNDEGNIGFLSIENRVCVALSRAKHGLYIMGNMNMLSGNSKPSNPWPKIKSVLESMNALGDALEVRCIKHPDQVTSLKTIKDFEKVPEGGCMQPCGEPLRCGHQCISICHILAHESESTDSGNDARVLLEDSDKDSVGDAEGWGYIPRVIRSINKNKLDNENKLDKEETEANMYIQCRQPCLKTALDCEFDHMCQQKCCEKCEPCNIPKIRQLNCDHIVDIPCFMKPDTVLCSVYVQTKLPCDHETLKPCHKDPKTFKCPHQCDSRIERCGHSCTLTCHIRDDPDHIDYQCKKKCEKSMANCSQPDNAEHKCMGLCSDTCSPCSIMVQKKRTICPHMFKVLCSRNVDEVICGKPCKKKLPCNHKCVKKCSEECGNCKVKVSKLSACGHEVMIECHEEPQDKDCSGKCSKPLPCGHICTKKCKDVCTQKCREMVINPNTSPCGHIFKIPCCLTDVNVDVNKLMVYCQEKCTKNLECTHTCAGSCGECAQGRMHKQCQEKCAVTLVCNHECKTPCQSICQPCTEKCSYACVHSKCKQLCGKPCTLCKEDCARKCEHLQCKNKCFEKCNVEPCNMPCKKILNCGHNCIGFCGDICPPKCKICNADEILEVFFGTEDEEDARFIYLKECGHILESSGMDQWLQQSVEKGSIAIKKCPKCKTTLTSTQRYSDYIKGAYEDINIVKKKFYGSQAENELKRKKLSIKMAAIVKKSEPLVKFSPLTKKILKKFLESLKVIKYDKLQPFYEQLIKTYISKIEIYEQILNIFLAAKIKNKESYQLAIDYIEFLLGFMLHQDKMISNQEINDYLLELNRLTRIMQFIEIVDMCNTFATKVATKEIYQECYKTIFAAEPYNANIDDIVKSKLEEFNTIAKANFIITEQEKRVIVRAIGLGTGHWFKCPNGHVYAIGECGGATEKSICPECKEAIGGTRVATEMDRARAPAFLCINYLENYKLYL